MNYLAALSAGIDVGQTEHTSEQTTANLGSKYTKTASSEQHSFIGNRCGHKRTLPRFMPERSDISRFPKILQKAHLALTDSYFNFKKMWRSLNFLNGQQKRSERREACILVGQYLNLRVKLNDFTINSPAKQIASHTKLTLNRVKRALRDLTRAGYIRTVSFIKHCFKGAWYGITGIRKLTSKFYLELGNSEYAIESAIKHKRGEKMVDTRTKKNQLFTSIVDKAKNIYSAVNKMDFHEAKNPKKTISTCDMVAERCLPEDITLTLVKQAKEIAKAQGIGWWKVYHALEQEWRAQNF